MIKGFVDKDGQMYDLWLNPHYEGRIRTQEQLIKLIHRTIALKEVIIYTEYHKKPYMAFLRDFGFISQSRWLGRFKHKRS